MPKASEIFSAEELAIMRNAVKVFNGKITKVWSWDPAIGPTWADGSLMKGWEDPNKTVELNWE